VSKTPKTIYCVVEQAGGALPNLNLFSDSEDAEQFFLAYLKQFKVKTKARNEVLFAWFWSSPELELSLSIRVLALDE
jgi:hypothetical protein